MKNPTLTAVPGIRVGHATHQGGETGSTVVLGPFRGACDVRGQATGTRELDALAPTHLVPRVDAILLTGGSAFGLAAADGVMKWVAAQGGGFETGAGRVPIVPAAVIFDLTEKNVAPDAALGFAACEAASADPVKHGRIGAGTGATVGKMRGPAHAQRAGIGTHAMAIGNYTIGALVVVNAVGDVFDFDGRIIAGARDDRGAFIDSLTTLSRMDVPANISAANTTLAVVATDAPLSRTALQLLARAASCAIARRIAPVNTVFDGDVVFAVSTAAHVHEFAPPEMLAFGAAAQLTLEHAIIQAAAQGVSE